MPHEEVRDWLKGLLKDYARHHPEVFNRVKGPARVFLPAAPEPDIGGYAGLAAGRAFDRTGWRVTVPAGGSYTTPLLPGLTLTLDPHAPVSGGC